MVDCADRDRIDEAKQELHRIINDREMKDAIILIFANKQDLPEGELYVKEMVFKTYHRDQRHNHRSIGGGVCFSVCLAHCDQLFVDSTHRLSFYDACLVCSNETSGSPREAGVDKTP